MRMTTEVENKDEKEADYDQTHNHHYVERDIANLASLDGTYVINPDHGSDVDDGMMDCSDE